MNGHYASAIRGNPMGYCAGRATPPPSLRLPQYKYLNRHPAKQGQAGCTPERDSPLVARSLLRDTQMARKVVVERQVSLKTDAAESTMKETLKPTLTGVQFGDYEREPTALM